MWPLKNSIETWDSLWTFFFFRFQIEKTSTSELCSFFSLVIIGGILFTLSGYFRSIILALKLKGPPVVPFLGNALLIKKRDGKFFNDTFFSFDTKIEILALKNFEMLTLFLVKHDTLAGSLTELIFSIVLRPIKWNNENALHF